MSVKYVCYIVTLLFFYPKKCFMRFLCWEGVLCNGGLDAHGLHQLYILGSLLWNRQALLRPGDAVVPKTISSSVGMAPWNGHGP